MIARIKYASHIILAALMLCLFTGCPGDDDKLQKEQQARQAAEVQRQEAEKQRQAAEQQRLVAEQSKSNWQTVAWVVGVAAVGLLVFGTALGSSARKDAATRKDTNE